MEKNDNQTSDCAEKESPTSNQTNSNRRRILVVDDASIIRNVLIRILSDEYDIVGEASNGVEAVRQYKKLLPDLVIMDISMPDMTGIEALEMIKKVNPQAKVTICSAISQKIQVLKAVKAGADYYIAKPFNALKVKEVVRKILG
jgi:two-component system chemotaxis response regulator CheY